MATHYIPRHLLTYENAKTIKGEKLGYRTAILYLAPHALSGVMNVCPKATEACIASCLNLAGRGGFTKVQQARVNKTHYLFNDRDAFMDHMRRDIHKLIRDAATMDLKPAVRCNGTSDLAWMATTLAAEFPAVDFYDYTKLDKPETRVAFNYRVTFSYSGSNLAECLRVLGHGVNVAVVFTTRKGQPLPATWHGFPVIDGDLHDLRFLDPRGVVVGLRAKGPAKKIASPFVVLAA